jgi:hypothetical protein
LAAAMAVLAPAAGARADTISSSNWAGYVAHGTTFREVSARWREPKLRCSASSRTYSAIWVGLGGFATGSDALEQVGTEADCSGSRRTLTSAWYELVPAASQPIRIDAWPGDRIAARVRVTGGLTTVVLNDMTRRERFTRTVQAPAVDISSADWIVEAPSQCRAQGACRQLPLADFGAVPFSRARAVSLAGSAGGISSRGWLTTRLVEAVRGPEATPSSLASGGTAFTVRRGA